MKRVAIVLFIVLITCTVAVPCFARSDYDHATEKHLPGEPDQCEVARWSLVRGCVRSYLGDSPSYLPENYIYCIVCSAPQSYWTCEIINAGKNNGYYYDFHCSACLSDLRMHCRYTDENSYFTYPSELYGEYGSPFLGHATQILDSIKSFSNTFLSFIVSNWLTLVIIAVPLISLGLTFVFKLRSSI